MERKGEKPRLIRELWSYQKQDRTDNNAATCLQCAYFNYYHKHFDSIVCGCNKKAHQFYLFYGSFHSKPLAWEEVRTKCCRDIVLKDSLREKGYIIIKSR